MTRFVFSFLTLAGAIAAPACMTDTTTEPTQAALEEDNGGLTMTDEAPMFGADAAYDVAAVEPATAVADPIAQDASVAAMNAQPDVARLRVAIVWGHLPPDPTITAVTDWSGTIAASRGALVVHHTIGFEAATDHLLPRPDLRTVAFDSKTRPFADGLVLELLDPTPGAGPLTLTYTPASGATPIVFTAAALLGGPVSVDVGADGDRMIAIALRHDACEHGFLRGRWHALAGELGAFLGHVADDDGHLIGHVRGFYGVRKSGERVFFGKYIGLAGEARGILAGHWDGGHFVGRWLDKDGEHGRVQGLYHEGAGDDRAGHFLGRWAESSCAADLPQP